MNLEKAIAEVAEQYRSEGYEVTLHPNDTQVPSFAAGMNLGLLATKNGEHVLVQIKETREDLQNDPASIRHAEVINAQPGWRLDLFVLNAEFRTERLARQVPEPTADGILRNLDYAERSAHAGDLAASFVIAWGSLEATMRRAARAAGIELQNISPLFLLRALYSNGLLDRSEFDQLSGYLRVRNAVVHGLETPNIAAAAPLYVVSAARKLLSEAGQEKAAT